MSQYPENSSRHEGKHKFRLWLIQLNYMWGRRMLLWRYNYELRCACKYQLVNSVWCGERHLTWEIFVNNAYVTSLIKTDHQTVNLVLLSNDVSRYVTRHQKSFEYACLIWIETPGNWVAEFILVCNSAIVREFIMLRKETGNDFFLQEWVPLSFYSPIFHATHIQGIIF